MTSTLSGSRNIDRKCLVAILAERSRAAWSGLSTDRTNAYSALRVSTGLSFFQHGDTAPDMSEHDIELCESVDQKLRD